MSISQKLKQQSYLHSLLSIRKSFSNIIRKCQLFGFFVKAPIYPSRLVRHFCPINPFARWEKKNRDCTGKIFEITLWLKSTNNYLVLNTKIFRCKSGISHSEKSQLMHKIDYDMKHVMRLWFFFSQRAKGLMGQRWRTSLLEFIGALAMASENVASPR